MCVETTRLFRGEELVVCKGIVDCAGVCNGEAVKDCYGECNGLATRDCAGQCQGNAFVNHCGFCVGGRTNRRLDLGTDKCGIVCWSAKNYRRTWDCHGTCNGTAFFDKCRDCVGGETGKSENFNADRIDCRGFCNGGWIQDGCGYCVRPPKRNNEIDPTTTSRHRDCNDTCHLPGTRFKMKARLNDCGVCFGGGTGLTSFAGKNACDQCLDDPEANVTSCTGCDGVPSVHLKSRTVVDVCGVCGGKGTDCVGVSKVSPRAIQANIATKLSVFGAGFSDNAELDCVFIGEANNHEHFKVTERISQSSIVCEPILAPGIYQVTFERDGILLTDLQAPLTVFEDIPILEISPPDIALGGKTFELLLVAEDAAAFTALKEVATPYVIAEGDAQHSGDRFLVPGEFTADDNELHFTGPVPRHSMRAYIWGSLDGINKLSMDGFSEGFPLTFWAEEPMLKLLQFNPNGGRLNVRFDRRVAYENLKSCDDIFETTTKLGENAECVWLGPSFMQVVIGTGNDLIVSGEELTLREGAVRTFKQDYSYAASGSFPVEAPRKSVKVRARLRGTKRITSCGKVRLNGRNSGGGAGRDMTYSWAVNSDGNVAGVQEILSGFTGADLTIEGSLLDVDVLYTFELTVTNFLGASRVDTMEVSRSAVATPEVAIVPKNVDISNVLISKRFALSARVTFYACAPPGPTKFTWSVDNDDIPLNLRTINKRTLSVNANTLPGNENITFTCRIYKESDPDSYAEQSITVTTYYSDLVAVIVGGNEITVGRGAGNVTIDGSRSYDPNDVALDMTYTWLCEQVTDGTACWSYTEEGQLFPNAEASTKPVLNFDGLAMEADKVYTFTLQVVKDSRSATASVNIVAMTGDPPRITMRPIEGKVKSHRVLSLKANIKTTSAVSGYTWETVGTELATEGVEDDEAFAYLDLNDATNLIRPTKLFKVNMKTSVNILAIKQGKLTPGSAYMFQLNVSTVDGQYGLAKVDVHILSDVTSCSLGTVDGIDAYTELDKVELMIENCVADDTALPLTYQMFHVTDDEGSLQAFSGRQSEPVITGVGMPAREGTNSNEFVAKVCDSNGSCRRFSKEFSVETKDTISEEEAHELKKTLVDEEKYKQNYVNALVNYNIISEKVDISFNYSDHDTSPSPPPVRRRRTAASQTSAKAAEQLELMELILESSVMDTAAAQLQIDQLSAIAVTDMTLADQSRLLDVIIQLTNVFVENEEESISQSGIDTVLAITTAIAQDIDPQISAAVVDKIGAVGDSISISQMIDLVVGGDPIVTTTDDVTRSIQLAIPSGVFMSKSSGGAASINFGTDIAARFGADWACSSGSCSGVTIHYDHYETDIDNFSTDEEDQNNRAADIVAIALLDPESREEIFIEDLADPITINMTITLPADNSIYECSSWNASASSWTTDGLTTIEHSATEVQCLTNHLSQFTVMAQALPSIAPTMPPDTESGGDNVIIIGAIVGGVAAVTLISIAVVFFMKRHEHSRRQLQVDDQEMQPQ